MIVAAVSDRRRRSSIDATIYVAHYSIDCACARVPKAQVGHPGEKRLSLTSE